MEETKIFPIKGLVYHRIKGKTCPRFVCQYCDEIITHAPAANIVWDMAETEAIVVHKQCDARSKSEGRRQPMSEGLHTALADLLWNSGMTDDVLKKAQDTAEGLNAI